MANELVIHYPPGSTLYALLFDATGQIWNGSAFAAPGSAAWTDYDIAMSEVATATGIYRASMPAAAAGVYGWVVRKQAGGTPAVSDITVGVGRIEWTGTAEIMPASTTNITSGTINSVSSTISANVVQMNGETDPVDNLVLALGNSSGVMISNAAVDAVWDEPISGHLTAGTTGAKLNTASSASGSGSTAYTDTVTDDSSNPLDGVDVWVTSDSVGASTVASTTTNTLGSFTVYLDPGTYYLWCAKGGINFPNPTTITVT